MTLEIGVRTTDYDLDLGARSAGLLDRPTTSSAHIGESQPEKVLTNQQKAVIALGIGVLAVAAVYQPLITALFINSVIVVYFGAANLFKLSLVKRSLGNPCALEVTRDELNALDDRSLPVYTILLPLYHEPQMVPQLIAGIAELNYPAEKLDVKILIEEDDDETRDALIAFNPPSHFEVLTIPDIGPKGKPRACNAGLSRARGQYLVIYDAEDRPEPDQLRKVVIGFRNGPPEMICIQAKLNYFNRKYNVLTRWFTAEYSVWFDQLLPGLQSYDVAIPLGGTSNHFITQRLRELGGWNAYNVTEDADLGMRVFVRGWKTAVIDSTTYEEATSRVGNWIRQRSRWVKGYMQTYLYCMRHPIRLYRQMGMRAFVAFQLFFGAGTFCLLINPLYLALTVAWFGFHPHVIQLLFPGGLLYVCSASFFLGNAAFTIATVSGCYARRHYDDVKWAMLAPIYWLLMSVAAWKGCLQLIYKPYYWEKTKHGFCTLPEQPPVAALPKLPDLVEDGLAIPA
ncbi:MAG: glycosyltransferase [Candidatus Dormibacteraeota bacterium]|nr:glycosyltransferase [Candidatus Dormibacteraeota bacterium]MBV9525749.1 glycosyltransferase [Candidatus Dormibacteraeota bacterium]